MYYDYSKKKLKKVLTIIAILHSFITINAYSQSSITIDEDCIRIINQVLDARKNCCTLISQDDFTITTGETKYKIFKFYEGKRYEIRCYPLEEIARDTNIDVYVYNENGNEVAKDNDEYAYNGSVAIRVNGTCEAKIVMKINRGSSLYPYSFRLLIFSKN